ncbi:NUDIX hydrolase [candidate division WOR-3 bacterium]|nr:NUDIX hydrolase [candidate division WOR-3 bacterium]
MEKYRQPRLTVDIIIKHGEGIILIERKNPPYGWAIPGGFVDYGETVEQAALREAKEETSLEVKNLKQFYVYSDPHRDPRSHTISVVFTGEADGTPNAASDAKNIGIFTETTLPDNIAFDHRQILDDYFKKEVM